MQHVLGTNSPKFFTAKFFTNWYVKYNRVEKIFTKKPETFYCALNVQLAVIESYEC